MIICNWLHTIWQLKMFSSLIIRVYVRKHINQNNSLLPFISWLNRGLHPFRCQTYASKFSNIFSGHTSLQTWCRLRKHYRISQDPLTLSILSLYPHCSNTSSRSWCFCNSHSKLVLIYFSFSSISVF